mgnify:CR=1 FL=1
MAHPNNRVISPVTPCCHWYNFSDILLTVKYGGKLVEGKLVEFFWTLLMLV